MAKWGETIRELCEEFRDEVRYQFSRAETWDRVMTAALYASLPAVFFHVAVENPKSLKSVACIAGYLLVIFAYDWLMVKEMGPRRNGAPAVPPSEGGQTSPRRGDEGRADSAPGRSDDSDCTRFGIEVERGAIEPFGWDMAAKARAFPYRRDVEDEHVPFTFIQLRKDPIPKVDLPAIAEEGRWQFRQEIEE